MTPLFLTLEEVLAIHLESVRRFGGAAEIRDLGLLQSALATPAAQFSGEWLHGDLAAMAAACLYHLVRNHPFVDGNKRTGAVAARVFLLMNGLSFDPPQDEYAETTLSVARGKMTKEALTAYFRENVRG